MSKVNFANSSWKSSESFLKKPKAFEWFRKVPIYSERCEISQKFRNFLKSFGKCRKIREGFEKFQKVSKYSDRLQKVNYCKVPESSKKFWKLTTAKVWFLPKNSKVPKIPNIKVHLISTKYNGQTKKYSEINFILRNKKSSETLKNHASLEITFLFIMFPLTRNVWEPKSPITKRVVWSIFIHLCIPNLFWLDD